MTAMGSRVEISMHRAIVATILSLLLIAPVAAAAAPVSAAAPAPAGSGSAEQGRLLERHAQTIERLRHSIEAVLGPLPAVAATPFFGLAALSGVAMAADTDLVRRSHNPMVRAFADNDLVREARRYASWPVLLVFLALALITYVANSGKVRGLAGKGLRLIEDAAVFLLYSALAAGALAAAAPAASSTAARAAAASALATAHPGVLTLGVAEVSWQVLTACGLAIGLAAMMITRYALDFLIWLVPVPFVDFCFETLKKLLAVGFIALYVFAPGAAAVLALLLAAGALLASGWALRIVGFAVHIVLRPWIARLDPAFAPRLVEPRRLGRRGVQRALEEGAAPGAASPGGAAAPRLAAHAVALAAPGLRKRQGGTLVRDEGGLYFTTRSWSGRRRRRPLSAPGQNRELVRRLLWTELRVTDPVSPGAGPGDAARAPRSERFAISRAFDFGLLCELLAARDARDAGDARNAAPFPLSEPRKAPSAPA
jgi:hypothetical protein